MLKKDHFLTGVLVGLLLPVICWLIIDVLKLMPVLNKPAVPYFIAVFFNLLAIRYFFKMHKASTGMGMMLVSFVCMVLVFWLKLMK